MNWTRTDDKDIPLISERGITVREVHDLDFLGAKCCEFDHFLKDLLR